MNVYDTAFLRLDRYGITLSALRKHLLDERVSLPQAKALWYNNVGGVCLT